jgi:hypothetical protein
MKAARNASRPFALPYPLMPTLMGYQAAELIHKNANAGRSRL